MQHVLAALMAEDILQYLVFGFAVEATLCSRLRLFGLLSLRLGPLEVVVDVIIYFKRTGALATLRHAITQADPRIGG